MRISITCSFIMLVALALVGTGSDVHAVEQITYFHPNALGSPVAATDESGNILWREIYQPYGERIKKDPAAASNTRWYTGHPQDPETGLTYMGARYYDPVIGRFMAVDSQGFDEKNLHSFNRYAYGNNNPYKYVDPDGNAAFLLFLIPVLENAAAGAAISGGLAFAADAISQWAGFGNFTDVSLAGAAQEAAPAAAAGALGGAIGRGAAAAWAARSATNNAARGTTTVIGRVEDLQKIGPGEKSLLDRLPNLGDPKANWHQNAGVLREEMRRGLPIRDASPGDTAGQFLNAERNLLRDRGWTFDPQTNYWMPPTP